MFFNADSTLFNQQATQKLTLATRNCTLLSPLLLTFPRIHFTDTFLRIENELSRLNRNKERRFAREKQKGVVRTSGGDSPAEGGSGSGKSAGTQRKCANCGQVGHIKTNKKYALPRNYSLYRNFLQRDANQHSLSIDSALSSTAL